MAKQGPTEQGQYNPFNAIADSLSDLASGPSSTSVTEQPIARRTNKRTMEPPARPVSVDPPAPIAEPQPARDDTSHNDGGAGRSLPIPASPTKSKTVSATSALQTTKRFKTTKQEGLELDAAAVKLGAALGVSVDFSKVTRALWDVYLRHQEDILRNVPEGELWERPANNDAAGLAELDQRLADLINEGLMVACRRPQNNR